MGPVWTVGRGSLSGQGGPVLYGKSFPSLEKPSGFCACAHRGRTRTCPTGVCPRRRADGDTRGPHVRLRHALIGGQGQEVDVLVGQGDLCEELLGLLVERLVEGLAQ